MSGTRVTRDLKLYRRATDHYSTLTRPAVVRSRLRHGLFGERDPRWLVVSPRPIPGHASLFRRLHVRHAATFVQAIAMANASAVAQRTTA